MAGQITSLPCCGPRTSSTSIQSHPCQQNGGYSFSMGTAHTQAQSFMDALWKWCIVPLCLPPHCTHVMQPLDVSIFGPLTSAYQHLVTELALHVAASGIDKVQFGSLYAQARAKTLTTSEQQARPLLTLESPSI